MKTLFLIPARAGSKGVPGKNTRNFLGKPLISYTIEAAQKLKGDICISTDSDKVMQIVTNQGIPALARPPELCDDKAGMDGVIMHALNYYKKQGRQYDVVVLLQPTSPLRRALHIKEALKLYSNNIDMVVSVTETPYNPYYVLFEENTKGYLEISKNMEGLHRRQDVPPVYWYNGAIYVINVNSFIKHEAVAKLPKIKKYIMPQLYSFDIDTQLDWEICEFVAKNNWLLDSQITKLRYLYNKYLQV